MHVIKALNSNFYQQGATKLVPVHKAQKRMSQTNEKCIIVILYVLLYLYFSYQLVYCKDLFGFQDSNKSLNLLKFCGFFLPK